MERKGHYRIGHFDRQTDTKGRLSLPVEWRPPAGESLYLAPVTFLGVQGLRALSHSALNRKLTDIEALPDVTSAFREQAESLLFGALTEVKVNDQGKMMIPKALATDHEIPTPGAVRIVGRGELFEIFTEENAVALAKAESAAVKENETLNAVLGFIS